MSIFKWYNFLCYLAQSFIHKQSVKQASSELDLNKCRLDLASVLNDVNFKKSQEKDSVTSSSKQGIFIPLQAVKHHVTEKVAQVSQYNYFI